MNIRVISSIVVLGLVFSTVAAQEERWLTDALQAAKVRLGLTEQQAKDLREARYYAAQTEEPVWSW